VLHERARRLQMEAATKAVPQSEGSESESGDSGSDSNCDPKVLAHSCFPVPVPIPVPVPVPVPSPSGHTVTADLAFWAQEHGFKLEAVDSSLRSLSDQIALFADVRTASAAQRAARSCEAAGELGREWAEQLCLARVCFYRRYRSAGIGRWGRALELWAAYRALADNVRYLHAAGMRAVTRSCSCTCESELTHAHCSQGHAIANRQVIVTILLRRRLCGQCRGPGRRCGQRIHGGLS
jgi:hypothetical protein